MRRVAVLGGGPAGAMAAERLAAGGVETILFDEKLAWEKPCGGGVTFKAYRQYPFLLDSGAYLSSRQTQLAAENAGAVELRLRHELLVFSRTALNQLLLDRAAAAGARLRQTRVTALDREASGGWRIVTRDGESVAADFVVVATGGRNPLKGVGATFRAEDSMTALGYFVPGGWPRLEIQFFRGFEGYIWVFPRTDHLSVGICGKGQTAQQMRQRLETYMKDQGLDRAGSKFYGHMLPSLAVGSWKPSRLAGPGWFAVGDAAGLVDPVTGEGIYYAMRSGELAGECLASGTPDRYASAVEEEFGHDLAYAATLAGRLFLGQYLWGPNTARMVQFLRRSPRLREIVQELFAGTMSYGELRKQIKSSLHTTAAEIGVNLFLRRIVQEG